MGVKNGQDRKLTKTTDARKTSADEMIDLMLEKYGTTGWAVSGEKWIGATLKEPRPSLPCRTLKAPCSP